MGSVRVVSVSAYEQIQVLSVSEGVKKILSLPMF